MPLPKYIDDGSWATQAVQDGTDIVRFPFYEKGDASSFEIDRDYVYEATRYAPPPIMSLFTTKYGVAYLVNVGDGQTQPGGLTKVTLTLARVPYPRFEPSTYAYSRQYWTTTGDPAIEESTYTTNAKVKYEYALAAFEPVLSPRRAVVFGVYIDRGDITFTAPATIAAEDSECGVYKARIYFRRTIYIDII